MGVEKFGAEGCALAGGAAIGTLGCATAAVGATGATSAIATVGALATSLPVVGPAAGAGISIGIAAAPVVVPAAIIGGAAYGLFKVGKWLAKNA